MTPTQTATAAAAAPEKRRRIKQIETMVADVIQETPDTNTLLLFTGTDRLEYEAGHFLTIDPHQFEALERFTAYFEDVKGKRAPPRVWLDDEHRAGSDAASHLHTEQTNGAAAEDRDRFT